mgnify:CR=1 FL=1
MFSWSLMLGTSEECTRLSCVSLSFLFFDFFVKMWRLKACFLLILPLPVTLNRFFALDFVFTLGISPLFSLSLRSFLAKEGSQLILFLSLDLIIGYCQWGSVFSSMHYFFLGLIIMIIFLPSSFGICSSVPNSSNS